MMKLQRILFCLLLSCPGREVLAQTTPTTDPVGFLNVQGVLHENGAPVNGFMWFCFDYFAVPTGGSPLGHDTNMNQVLVSNGVANVTYNLGHVATLGLSATQTLYLQIDVSRTGWARASASCPRCLPPWPCAQRKRGSSAAKRWFGYGASGLTGRRERAGAS